MKQSFLLFLFSSALVFSAQAQQELPVYKDIVVGINDVFVPGGFDSSSDSYVVVNGIFPNGCYQWKEAKVKNLSEYDHEITSMAKVSQGMCIQVLIPYSKDIKLGKLSTGKHSLRFLSGDGTYLEKNMVIE